MLGFSRENPVLRLLSLFVFTWLTHTQPSGLS